jgi:hypothetical protein
VGREKKSCHSEKVAGGVKKGIIIVFVSATFFLLMGRNSSRIFDPSKK